jgi:hypothetical protein
MKNLLIYIDSGFLSEGGHYKTFAGNLREYVRLNNNWRLTHYVSKNVSSEDVYKYELHPIFSYYAYLPNDLSDVEVKKRIEDFRKNLNKIFKNLRFKHKRYKKIVFYMYTSNPLYIQIFGEMLKKYKFKNVFVSTVLFYLNNNFCRGLSDFSYEKLLSETNNMIKDIPSLFLYMDSDLAIERYQQFFDKEILILPRPLLKEANINKYYEESDWSRKKKTKIGYFGYITKKHGFDCVFEIIKRLNRNKYNFVVRINDRMQREKDLLWKVNVLKVLPNVTLVNGYIDNYWELLRACDFILIPYSIKDYPVQTSGVLIDSILNNKQIIAREGTWIGNQVKNINIGFTFSNIEDLKEKIINYEGSEVNADRRVKFLKSFTVEKFFEYISKY